MSLAFASDSAHAVFHLWQIKEVFSSADGSVQFVELFNTSDFEQFVGGQILEANSDGVIKTFKIPADLPNPPETAGRHMLIATAGLGVLPGGVTPDYTFDQSTTPFSGSLFDPNAAQITLNFYGSGSTAAFSGAASPPSGYTPLPKDGVHSLTSVNFVFESAINSPTNFSNQAGSVNLAVPEPAGAILAIAVWGLFGIRLRLPGRGGFAQDSLRRKSRLIIDASSQGFKLR